LRQEATDFQREHPATTFTIHHYEENETLIDALGTEEPEGSLLILGNARLLRTLHQKNLLHPLDELLTKSEMADLAPLARISATQDGRLWGLADTLGFHLLLYYNRDMIAVPPTNTEELSSVARSFTTPRERWGLAVNSYDPLWVVPWLSTCGDWLIDARGKPTLDTPAMVAALSLYRDWHTKRDGIAPLAAYHEARQLFAEGQAAMLIDGEWVLGELRAAARVNWDVSVLPARDKSECHATPLVMGRYWMVRRAVRPEVQRVTVDFLQHVFTPERQLSWAMRFGVLPTHRRALQDSRILNDPWLRISAQQMQAGRALPLGVDADRLLDAMRAPLRAMLDEDITPEETARSMQKNLGEYSWNSRP